MLALRLLLGTIARYKDMSCTQSREHLPVCNDGRDVPAEGTPGVKSKDENEQNPRVQHPRLPTGLLEPWHDVTTCYVSLILLQDLA